MILKSVYFLLIFIIAEAKSEVGTLNFIAKSVFIGPSMSLKYLSCDKKEKKAIEVSSKVSYEPLDYKSLNISQIKYDLEYNLLFFEKDSLEFKNFEYDRKILINRPTWMEDLNKGRSSRLLLRRLKETKGIEKKSIKTIDGKLEELFCMTSKYHAIKMRLCSTSKKSFDLGDNSSLDLMVYNTRERFKKSEKPNFSIEINSNRNTFGKVPKEFENFIDFTIELVASFEYKNSKYFLIRAYNRFFVMNYMGYKYAEVKSICPHISTPNRDTHLIYGDKKKYKRTPFMEYFKEQHDKEIENWSNTKGVVY